MAQKAPKLPLAEMKALHARGIAAAEVAFEEAATTTMIVGSPKDPVASLMGDDSGGLDPDQPQYVVPDGPCGFAWVNVKPGTSRFAKFLVKEGYARTDSYYGGVSVWSPGAPASSQSYQRKMAGASAYAAVLREAGITAYANGRLD